MKNLLWICLFCLLTACAKGDKSDTLTFDPVSLTMHTREQVALNLVDANGESISSGITWESSAPATIEVLSGGIIRAKQTGKAIITAVYDNKTARCEVTVEPNVYMAGFQQTDKVRTAVYWKNGQAFPLEDKLGAELSQATSIFVIGDDVYVAGYGIKNNGRNVFPVYWKNGVITLLPHGTEGRAESVFVDQENVYIAGYDGDYACYWKNGNQVVLDGTQANTIYIVNNNVYVAGTKGSTGTYWVNGLSVDLPADGTTWVNDMFISGSDVYVAGQVNMPRKQTVAQYWKNGTPVVLTDGTREAYVDAIWVDGNDVYACGGERDAGNGDHATYWKNGIPTVLDGTAAYDIKVLDTDIFVAGWKVVKEKMTLALYWHNDEMIVMPNTGQEFVCATAICVE